MKMRLAPHILIAIRWLLLGTAITPLLVSNRTTFPFVFPKIVYFRTLVELAVGLFFALLVFYWNDEITKELRKKLIQTIKHPLFIAISLYLFSMIVSSLFADNIYRAFWGDIERGEGVFGILHAYIFLILATLFFEKNDWARYFKVTLISGAILIIYAFFEHYGLRFLLFAPRQNIRAQSLIGNSAFLATHLIFISIFSFLYFYIVKHRTLFVKWFSFLLFIFSIFAIFLTETRGAILGIGVGFITFLILVALNRHIPYSFHLLSYRMSLRAVAVIFISLSVLFAGVFLATRNAGLWQKIPGLNRLAQTSTLDVNDPATQFRIITWDLSWKAFKERPLVGWGPENYMVAFEKFYNPQYAIYGETWLDRAHNKIFDVLVMQGVIGIVTYLGIFITLIYFLWKRITREILGEFFPIIVTSGIVAYFIQNLVLFDQIVSDITLFALFGFLVYMLPSAGNMFDSFFLKILKIKISQNIRKIIFVLIGMISLYSIVELNFIPYMQAVRFKSSPGVSQNAHDVELVLKQAMNPFNFAQYNIRAKGMDEIYSSQYFENEKYVSDLRFRPIGLTLIDAIQELVTLEPYDVRISIRLVEMLNNYSHGMNDTEIIDDKIYERVEKLIRDALKRAPNRQELYYHLSFNLAAQKKYDEAIKVVKYAISLEPSVARAHYHLALIYYLSNNKEETIRALAKTEELSPNFERFMPTDISNIALFYKKLGLNDKFANFTLRTLFSKDDPRIVNYILSRIHYEDALRYFIAKKDSESAIKIAEYLYSFPDLKKDMNIIIDLINKGKWPTAKDNGQEKITTVTISRDDYENALRQYILNKDKENAIKMAEYLLVNYKEYSSRMGIETILDLLKKNRWDIIDKLP